MKAHHLTFTTALCFLTCALPVARSQTIPETTQPSIATSGDDLRPKTVRLEEIEVTERRTSALTQAPTESSLDAVQPQSVIDISTISNSVAPSADYTMVANLAPSVTTVQANGPGLSEAKNIMRGFSDGQYNVTYDGVPFSDNNSFSHHSTSYFPAKIIGRMTVDRGPGTASTVGEATFGGTIAMQSKDPRAEMSVVPTFSYGSFNTFVGHLEGNTGKLEKFNGASAIGSYQYMSSDGFLTGSYFRRTTTYFKYLQPIGKNTTLTFLTTFNWIQFGTPGSVTQATIDANGRNFGLVNDPNNILSPLYNYQTKQADFNYIGLNTDLGNGWRVDNKVLTYSYRNGSYQSPTLGTKTSKTNIGGTYQLNAYRSYADIAQLIHEDAAGTFKTGFWAEYIRNPRYQYLLDYSIARHALDFNRATTSIDAGTLAATTYLMVDFMKTGQAFAEYEWHATRDLSINAGVRYAHFHRDIEAPVNQTTRLRYFGERTDVNTMPSLAANYQLRSNWSAYAQVAKGYLAPNLQLFYVPDPSKDNVKPQETTNYQVGTVYKSGRFNGDIDAYWIDYKNFPLTITDTVTNQPYYALASGAYYSGIEAEGTYWLGGGLSAFANGSFNHAVFKKSKLDLPSVAKSTAAFGFVYNNGGFFASLSDKYIGASKIYASGLNPDIASSLGANTLQPAYSLADVAIGYSHKLARDSFVRSLKIKLQVDNAFDRKLQIIGSVSSKGVPSFTVLPDRDYFVTFSGEF